jgi:hypothetical protein
MDLAPPAYLSEMVAYLREQDLHDDPAGTLRRIETARR